jgi:hypothetical protein
MKKLNRHILLLLAILFAMHVSARDVDVNYLSQLRSPPLSITRDKIPASGTNYTLDEIVETSRRLDGAGEWIYGSLLMRLKDAPTIQKYAERYRDSDGQDDIACRAIAGSNAPWMISEVIQVLQAGEPVSEILGDTQVGLGPTGDTRVLITSLLATSPEFPDEVKNWARSHLSKRNIGRQNELIEIIRNWWTTNEAYLRAESFDKVQVPSSNPASLPPKQPAQQLAAPPAVIDPTPEPPAPPPPEPTPEPIKSSVAGSIPTPATEPAPANKTNPVWWIVGLLILAAGAVFVARKITPKA